MLSDRTVWRLPFTLKLFSLYLTINLKIHCRRIRTFLLEQQSIPVSIVIFIVGIFNFSLLTHSRNLWVILLAGLVPLLDHETLINFQKHIRTKPFTRTIMWIIYVVLPLISLNGVLLLIVFVKFIMTNLKHATPVYFFLIVWSYGLGLLYIRKVKFCSTVYLKEIFCLLALILVIVTYHFSSNLSFNLLFIVSASTYGLLWYSFQLPMAYSVYSAPGIINLIRPRYFSITNYLFLSFLKQINTFEFFFLVLVNIFACYYLFFYQKVAVEAVLILSVFQVSVCSLLSNNMLGLENSGHFRTWFIPFSGEELLKTKTLSISILFFAINTPLVIGQFINFGWLIGLLSFLNNACLWLIVLNIGVRSSLNSIVQRKFFAVTKDEIGGKGYLLVEFVMLIVYGIMSLWAVRFFIEEWLIFIFILNIVSIVALFKNIKHSGHIWNSRF